MTEDQAVAAGGVDGVARFLRSVSLALRAQRRMFRMDQRELSTLSGVPKSTVARLEKGDGRVALVTVVRVLEAAGLRLVLTHGNGTPWQQDEMLQTDALGVVDRAGRAFPAHLPATPSGYQQSWDWGRDRRWPPGSRTAWRYDFSSDDVEVLLAELSDPGVTALLDAETAEALDAEMADLPDADTPEAAGGEGCGRLGP